MMQRTRVFCRCNSVMSCILSRARARVAAYKDSYARALKLSSHVACVKRRGQSFSRALHVCMV